MNRVRRIAAGAGRGIRAAWQILQSALGPVYVLYALWLVVFEDDYAEGTFWMLVAIFFLLSNEIDAMRAAGRRRAVTRIVMNGDQAEIIRRSRRLS